MTWLEVLGIILLSLILYRIVWWLVCSVYTRVARQCASKLLVKGQWAVVTGASDGLGRAFVRQMAEKGMNVVLISRTKSKLSDVATEIIEEFKVETRVVEADFTGEDDVYANIEKELQGLDIGVLVNNVGVSYPHPEYFLDLKDNKKIYSDILKCNIEATINMCRIVMPGMVEKKKGVVINISSTAAHIPAPMLCVYAASKVFVTKFSKDLRAEYRKQGLVIQSFMPGLVATKMSKIRKATWMAPTPETYVRSALVRLGVSSSSTGYFPHSLLLKSLQLVESFSPCLAEHLIMRTTENIRQRNFRKAKREAAIQ